MQKCCHYKDKWRSDALRQKRFGKRWLRNALAELNNENKYIDDVQLTENGRWLILYDDNGIRWNDIPYSLEEKLREYNNQKK
jgi:hypothetical protein